MTGSLEYCTEVQPQEVFTSSITSKALPVFCNVKIHFCDSLNEIFPKSNNVSETVISVCILPFLEVILFPEIISKYNFFILSLWMGFPIATTLLPASSKNVWYIIFAGNLFNLLNISESSMQTGQSKWFSCKI